MQDKELVLTCPYCGSQAHLQDSAMVYGRSYGDIYLCDGFPFCDSFVGVHKGTTIPLGTMADSALRDLRKEAHALFDALWKHPKTSGKVKHKEYMEKVKQARTKAYSFLAGRLGIPLEECHIAMMDEAKCKQVIALFQDCQLSDELLYGEDR